MITYSIKGGKPLKGTIKIAGRKNAALPLIAASLLTTGKVTLNNLPDITDVKVMLQILESIGARIDQNDSRVVIDTKNVTSSTIPHDLGRKLRGSILFLGPLLARFGKLHMPHPGGCIIGKRPVGLHFDVIEAMGAKFKLEAESYEVIAKTPLRSPELFLSEASVTATENAIMAAVLGQGQTKLINIATEDHVTQLIEFLIMLGYKIEGKGSSIITIDGSNGVLANKNVELKIIADEIELGTFITAAVVTNGKVTMEDVGSNVQTLPIRSIFARFGVNMRYDETKQTLSVRGPHNLKPTTIVTGTWPGVPTDLQPPLALLATQIDGNTLIHDWMYEGRFVYVSNLEKMGASIINCDPHRILVHGKTNLTGTNTVSPDLRAGATQLIAALAAKGKSTLEHAELIERGYENIVPRLKKLGADIERTHDS